MEKIFVSDRKKMAYDCRVHMKKKYDIEQICNDQWIPFFEKIETEIYKDIPIEVPQEVQVEIPKGEDLMEKATKLTQTQFGADVVKEISLDKV